MRLSHHCCNKGLVRVPRGRTGNPRHKSLRYVVAIGHPWTVAPNSFRDDPYSSTDGVSPYELNLSIYFRSYLIMTLSLFSAHHLPPRW